MINKSKRIIQSLSILTLGTLMMCSTIKIPKTNNEIIYPKCHFAGPYGGVSQELWHISRVAKVNSKHEIENMNMNDISIEKNEMNMVTTQNIETGYVTSILPYYTEDDRNNPKGFLNFNEEIDYYIKNDAWGYFTGDDGINYYFRLEDLSDNKNESIDFDIAPYTGAKTMESYTAFGKNTPQNNLQDYATTDEKGFRRINGRYLVALGSRFTQNVGQYFDLVLSNGIVIPCMLSDQKADIDTDETNTYTISNETYCCSEFCVDLGIAESNGTDGDVSVLNDGWKSQVSQIKVYDYNFFSDYLTKTNGQLL